MEGSVNDSWQNFKQLLWKLMDDYIPVKNISSTSKTMKVETNMDDKQSIPFSSEEEKGFR